MTTDTAALSADPTPSDRDPVTRLRRLLDPGSMRMLHEPDGSGVVGVLGQVDGSPVSAYCSDARIMGGALGPAGAAHVVSAITVAERQSHPVIGLWHSGGARLADGVRSLHGAGNVFAAITRASGRVPQISVILGPAAGVAAYGSALTDVIVMARAGRMFITGPDIIRSVTHEDVDMETLGGPDAHARRSGVTHVIAEDENDACRYARRLAGLLGRGTTGTPARPADAVDPGDLLPREHRRAYDVRPLVRALLDRDGDEPPLLELQPGWAPNIVVGLGRIAGRSVGVVANNPVRKGGCLDSLAAEKAARFVRMCDSFGVPLVVVVDVPGYLPGVQQEWDGIVRRGAKLLHAFGRASVPRVTVMIRKAYGGAYIAMNSRALGATAVFAWPTAEVAVMGADAAVGILHRRQLSAAPDDERDALRDRLVRAHETATGGLHGAVELGVVDEVIEPGSTRRRIADILADHPVRRGDHDNMPL